MATVSSTANGIRITFDDGASITLPNTVGSPSLPDWHEYQTTYTVNRSGTVFTTDSVWSTLLNGPAPGTLIGGGPATTGSKKGDASLFEKREKRGKKGTLPFLAEVF
jgi:hypothetical protein